MERFVDLFKDITVSVLNKRDIKLEDIEISHQLVEAASHVYDDAESEFEF